MMTMTKINFYRCFSINLLRWLKIHGVKPVSKGTHENGKSFWIFEMDEELSKLLTAWSDNKRAKEGK